MGWLVMQARSSEKHKYNCESCKSTLVFLNKHLHQKHVCNQYYKFDLLTTWVFVMIWEMSSQDYVSYYFTFFDEHGQSIRIKYYIDFFCLNHVFFYGCQKFV
jgi:hypothetical protein